MVEDQSTTNSHTVDQTSMDLGETHVDTDEAPSHMSTSDSEVFFSPVEACINISVQGFLYLLASFTHP